MESCQCLRTFDLEDLAFASTLASALALVRLGSVCERVTKFSSFPLIRSSPPGSAWCCH